MCGKVTKVLPFAGNHVERQKRNSPWRSKSIEMRKAAVRYENMVEPDSDAPK